MGWGGDSDCADASGILSLMITIEGQETGVNTAMIDVRPCSQVDSAERDLEQILGSDATDSSLSVLVRSFLFHT